MAVIFQCDHIDKSIIVNSYLNGNKDVKERLIRSKVGEMIYVMNKIMKNETLNISMDMRFMKRDIANEV